MAHPQITVYPGEASFVYRRFSPACEVCRQGKGTLTSHISFRCHRDCFFCFNSNQENFQLHLAEKNPWKEELESYHRSGQPLTHIALTGGEPLLHPQDTLSFFRCSRELYPKAHLRLYTSGDLLTQELLEGLKEAGLDEIRFSYKMEDHKELQEKVLSLMALAKEQIPAVLVEMPVSPDLEEEMQSLLLRLEEIGIWGINLLELCFPFHNSQAFLERGYRLRYPPYRTLYNYWYAGGLPIAGSELAALRLTRFAAEKGLGLGVHYCSLENKHFGQLYQQNFHPEHLHPSLYFSKKDYFLKTIKAFGNDALALKRTLDYLGSDRYLYRPREGYLQFHPGEAKRLGSFSGELAISFNVLENRGGEIITREVKLLRTSLEECSPSRL